MQNFRKFCSRSFAVGSLALATCFVHAQMSPGSGGGGQSQQPQQQQPSTQSPMNNDPTAATSTGGDSASQMRDNIFLKESSQGNMAEIKLGQLALQKSTNDDVKQFAQKMVDDHTMLAEKMKPFAEKSGVKPQDKLPKDAQKEYDKLSSLSGANFDKEYIAGMVKDHHKDMKKFETEASLTQNADLKAAVTEGGKVIAEHTKMVEDLASKNNVAKSSM